MYTLAITTTIVSYNDETGDYSCDRFDSLNNTFWIERVMSGLSEWYVYLKGDCVGTIEIADEKDHSELLGKLTAFFQKRQEFEVVDVRLVPVQHLYRGITHRRVVCSAIQNDAGELVLGARHYDLMMRAAIEKRIDGESFLRLEEHQQGFVDQFGNYLTRAQAWAVAKKANQIYKPSGSSCGWRLYSECLY